MFAWQPSVEGLRFLARKTQRFCDFYAGKYSSVYIDTPAGADHAASGTELNN
jgi:hypothetical protein